MSWTTGLACHNGHQIPNDGTGHGLKHRIDTWVAAQAQASPARAHQVFFTGEEPPHIPTTHDSHVPSARIEEVTEAHIVQVVSNVDHSESYDDNPFEFFQVFVTERRKRETRRFKLPELQSSISLVTNAPYYC